MSTIFVRERSELVVSMVGIKPGEPCRAPKPGRGKRKLTVAQFIKLIAAAIQVVRLFILGNDLVVKVARELEALMSWFSED